MRAKTIGAIAVLLLAVSACTDERGRIEVSVPAAEPLVFGQEPLWSVGQDATDGAMEVAGLEAVSEMDLLGDHLVLHGYDHDGDPDAGGGGYGIAVLDARTGEHLWTRTSGQPLPEDDRMLVTGLGVWEQAHPIEVNGQAALAVPYEKPGTELEGEPEVGIAALALATGELLDSIRLRDGTASELTVRTKSTDAGVALLDVVDTERNSVDSMLVDFTAGELVWTRTDQAAVAIAGDTALLVDTSWYFPWDGETAVTAVGRTDGETLWGPSEPGSLHVWMHTTGLVIASNSEDTWFFDPATGGWTKMPTLGYSTYSNCASDDMTLIVCRKPMSHNLVAIPLNGAFGAAVVLPGTRDFTPVAVISGWIFLNKPGNGEPAFSTMDAAGNTVEVPGLLGSAEEGLAAFYTGGNGGLYSVHSISVYEVGP